MNHFTILIFLFSSLALGQEAKTYTRPGVQLATVFSSDDNHGISTALTLNFRRAQLSVGPRFAYRRMLWEKSKFYDKDNQVIIDAAFRHYFMQEEKTVRLFVQAGAEYRYTSTAHSYYYISDQMLAYGPVIDYSFPGEWDKKTHYFSVCTVVGIDVNIWKQLSVFANAGVGTSFSHTASVLNNLVSGRVEYSDKNATKGQLSWIAATGLGYRF